MEAPFEMLKFTFGFIANMLSTCDPNAAEVAWANFMDNLLHHLQTKRGFDAEGKPISLATEVPQAQQVNGDADDQAEPNEPNECSICLDKAANTVVMPCEHSVVCEQCSKDLKNTNDRAVCCQCRNPIDAVYYPDNTVESVNKS